MNTSLCKKKCKTLKQPHADSNSLKPSVSVWVPEAGLTQGSEGQSFIWKVAPGSPSRGGQRWEGKGRKPLEGWLSNKLLLWAAETVSCWGRLRVSRGDLPKKTGCWFSCYACLLPGRASWWGSLPWLLQPQFAWLTSPWAFLEARGCQLFPLLEHISFRLLHSLLGVRVGRLFKSFSL